MNKKPTHEKLVERVRELEQEAVEHKRMLASLQESEELHRELLENSYDTPYSVMTDGTITYIGRQFERFGYTPEEAISKNYLDFVAPEQRELVMEQFETGTRNGTSFPTEFQMQGKDGRLFWVETVGRIIFDDSGNPVKQVGVLRDISKRKENIKKQEDSLLFLQMIIDSIEGEVFVKDTNGKYLFVNRAFGKDFDVDLDDVIGKDDYFVFMPETAAKLQENDRRIMAQKKAESVEESTILRGKYTTYLTSKVPLIDNNGDVIGICGIGFDITHQKELEEALKRSKNDLEKKVEERTAGLSAAVNELREAEDRYRTVADFTYNWEYWITQDGTLKYVSPSCERISGYTPQEFINNPSLFRDIVIPEDQLLWNKHIHDSPNEMKLREIEFRIQRKDGAVRWILHACQPITGGRVAGLLGFRCSNRDITKRMEAVIKLREAYSEIKALKNQLEADRTYLQEEIKFSKGYEHIIGNSDSLRYVLFRAEQIASSDTTVLILGETGTGKELIARVIHDASARKDRPLIKVDCAALPSNLIESELFGHEKGAFTGAANRREGRFELANNTTLFLDEVGDLPLELQPKLLRVLQDGEFEPLGSSKTLKTNVRIIAATNRNLEEDVNNKKFRMDLFYRLNVFTITMPPLRERSEDLGLLVHYMIRKYERKHGKRIRSLSSEAFGRLQAYSWPGNIRELENVIQRAIINSKGDMLQLADVLSPGTPDKSEPPDLPVKSLEEVEREHILTVLRMTNWKIQGESGASELLDINSSTLRGRMRKLGIRRPPYQL